MFSSVIQLILLYAKRNWVSAKGEVDCQQASNPVMHSLGVILCMSLLFLEPAPFLYTYAFSTFCCWVFYVFVLVFDLFVHVAPAGAPAWAMRLCQGKHVNLPSLLSTRRLDACCSSNPPWFRQMIKLEGRKVTCMSWQSLIMTHARPKRDRPAQTNQKTPQMHRTCTQHMM